MDNNKKKKKKSKCENFFACGENHTHDDRLHFPFFPKSFKKLKSQPISLRDKRDSLKFGFSNVT